MEVGSRKGWTPLFLARVAAFIAIGVVVGMALVGVPNVELVTAVCFISGFLLGTTAGLITGALTELLFAGFNPMGSSAGVLLVSQVIGMSFAGFSGALAAMIIQNTAGLRFAISIVLFGAVATIIFDIITNLAFPLMAGFSFSQISVYLIAGIPFAAIHLASNCVLFSLIVVPILPKLRKALAST